MIKSDLIMKLRAGDESAYAELFKVTYPRLISYCKLFVSDENISDDLVQDCFLKLWSQRRELKPDKSVESLLFVMLRNRCLNYLRDQKMVHQAKLFDDENWNDIQHLFQIDFLGKEEEALESLLIEALKKAIDELPHKRREVFVRCKVYGEKQKEVAKELGLSIKTVEKHIRLAKDELFNKLKIQSIMLIIYYYLHY